MDEVVASVRNSLRTNLVEHHLNLLHETHEDELRDPPVVVLLLAVSGGSDSIALLHSVLRSVESSVIDDERTLCLKLGVVGDEYDVPCQVHVAHFNHEQRGENSDGDEMLVESLCRESGLPFHCYRWSDGSTCLESSEVNGNKDVFSQNTARRWRRRELKNLLSDLVPSKGHAFGAILTAHHRDDADETILLKLLRGSHLTNLAGMEARSDPFELGGSDQRSRMLGYFVKPCLELRKTQIVDFLTSNSYEWREDESNSSNKYKRNKIRNELMPLLSEIAGGDEAIHTRFRNLEQQSREIGMDLALRAQQHLDEMNCDSEFRLDANGRFDLAHEEALHLWVSRATCGRLCLAYDQMTRIRGQILMHPTRLQWELDIGKRWRLKRNGDCLTVSREGQDDGTDLVRPMTWTVHPSRECYSEGDIGPDGVELAFDGIAEGSPLVVKRVKDIGNLSFKPPWKENPIKITEFLRGQRVPLSRRGEAEVVCLVPPEESPHILAVYVQNSNHGEGAGKWVARSRDNNDSFVTRILMVRA